MVARKPGSGRPKFVRTVRNIRCVSELICSQEHIPQSHKYPREIERETDVSRTVQCIEKQDLQLVIGQVINENCKLKRMQRSQQVRLLDQLPNERSLRSRPICFIDEKTFRPTIATPVNSQNDRVYSEARKQKRASATSLVRERAHI